MQQKYLWGVGVLTVLFAGFGVIMYYGRPVMQNDYSTSISPAPTTTTQPSSSVRTPEPSVTSPSVSASSTAGRYTVADVQAHATETSCWTSIDGSVYDLTSWISRHPDGSGPILKLCGVDGTASFTRKHGGSGAAKAALALLKIGEIR